MHNEASWSHCTSVEHRGVKIGWVFISHRARWNISAWCHVIRTSLVSCCSFRAASLISAYFSFTLFAVACLRIVVAIIRSLSCVHATTKYNSENLYRDWTTKHLRFFYIDLTQFLFANFVSSAPQRTQISINSRCNVCIIGAKIIQNALSTVLKTYY